jgi:hypothetical protein
VLHPAASAKHDVDPVSRRAEDDNEVEESLVPILSRRQSKTEEPAREGESVYSFLLYPSQFHGPFSPNVRCFSLHVVLTYEIQYVITSVSWILHVLSAVLAW